MCYYFRHDWRLFVMESRTEDPFDGFSSPVLLENRYAAIDTTVFRHTDGNLYACYSRMRDEATGLGPGLEIRRMASPTALCEEKGIISSAEYPWEAEEPYVGAHSVNEGPFFLRNGDRLFLIYSANGCWLDGYCLGILEYLGGDILKKESWKKYENPLFKQGNGVFGPGHASFFRSPDGSETWVAYHGMGHRHGEKPEMRIRRAFVQKIHFDETGFPMLSEPMAMGIRQDAPSGEDDMEQIYYVSHYRKEGMSDDEVIAACFADAKRADARIVIFDEANYLISTSILLPSDTTMILDGCRIKQADECFDTAIRGDNLVLDEKNPNGYPLEVRPLRNIRILGKNGATISGPEKNRVGFHAPMNEMQEMVGDFWGWRTLTISVSLCDGLEVAGISFEKVRCWTMSFDMCQNGYIHDIRLSSNVKNGDGVDLRSGCRHFLIEHVTGSTSDDNIAMTALFYPNRIYPDGNGLYPLEPTRNLNDRTADEKDIHDVTVRKIETGGKCHGIICLAAYGCKVYDIRIEDITECDPPEGEVPWCEAVVKIYTGYGDGYLPGDLHDISVRNVLGKYAIHPVFSNVEVKNVTLENIRHTQGKKMRLDHPDGFTVIE